MLILRHKGQKFTLILTTYGLPGNTVIHHHRCQFKLEGILVEHIILYRHLECRPDNASYGMD